MTTFFDNLDTVKQRETYIKARNLSEHCPVDVVLYVRNLQSPDLEYAPANRFEHWRYIELITFNGGREI